MSNGICAPNCPGRRAYCQRESLRKTPAGLLLTSPFGNDISPMRPNHHATECFRSRKVDCPAPLSNFPPGSITFRMIRPMNPQREATIPERTLSGRSAIQTRSPLVCATQNIRNTVTFRISGTRSRATAVHPRIGAHGHEKFLQTAKRQKPAHGERMDHQMAFCLRRSLRSEMKYGNEILRPWKAALAR
jgi:hypothetical protein